MIKTFYNVLTTSGWMHTPTVVEYMTTDAVYTVQFRGAHFSFKQIRDNI